MTTGPRGREGELDPQAAAALRAFRVAEELPAATEARVWARVAASTRAEGTWPKGQVRRGVSEWVWAGVVVAAAAAVLLASRAGVLGPLVGSREGGEAAAYAERQAATSEPVRAGASEPVSGDMVRETDNREEQPSATSSRDDDSAREHVVRDMFKGTDHSLRVGRGSGEARASERRSSPAGSREGSAAESEASAVEASSLAQEAELLGRAQAAIQSSRAAEALTLLHAYAQQFPRGALREEHDALRALALCAGDRAAEGRAAAQVFLRAHGGSALAERVRLGCAEP